MPCVNICDEHGRVIGHACVRGSRATLCRFCRKNSVSLLCDFPTRSGKTCDKGMCDACATRVAVAMEIDGRSETVDYCPNHKDQVSAQEELFSMEGLL